MMSVETTRSRDVAAELRRDIQAGRIEPGRRLPTTRALSSRFGVSLPTVQTVLRELETQGLIECRARQGCVVKATRRRSHVRQTTIAVIRQAFREEDTQADNRVNRILRCAEQVLAQQGLHLTAFTHRGQEQSILDECMPKLDEETDRLAGVICCSRAAPEVIPQRMEKGGIPWLTIDRSSERVTRNFITADSLGAGRRLGYCFARMGLPRVLFLSLDVRTAMRGMDMMSGLFQGYIQAGAAPPEIDYQRFDDYSVELGRQRTLEVLDKRGKPDVVVSPGDYLAIGAIEAFAERGIDVPGEVSVVGGAGLEFSGYCRPSLTVMRHPMEAIGRSVGETLLKMIADRAVETPGVSIACEWLVRESCPVPPDVLHEVEKLEPLTLGRERTEVR